MDKIQKTPDLEVYYKKVIEFCKTNNVPYKKLHPLGVQVDLRDIPKDKIDVWVAKGLLAYTYAAQGNYASAKTVSEEMDLVQNCTDDIALAEYNKQIDLSGGGAADAVAYTERSSFDPFPIMECADTVYAEIDSTGLTPYPGSRSTD